MVFMMKFETRIGEHNQVMIPTYFMKKYNLGPENIVEWTENEKNELILTFKKVP